MKVIIGFVIGMIVAWFINLHLHKPVGAVSEVKAPYTKVNTDTFHNGINVWVDKPHQVVCWIYEAGVGGTSRAGISCLPWGQVSNPQG